MKEGTTDADYKDNTNFVAKIQGDANDGVQVTKDGVDMVVFSLASGFKVTVKVGFYHTVSTTERRRL